MRTRDYVKLPDAGQAYGNNLRTIASNAILFTGTERLKEPWELANMPHAQDLTYRKATAAIKRQQRANAENERLQAQLFFLQARLRRLQAESEGGAK